MRAYWLFYLLIAQNNLLVVNISFLHVIFTLNGKKFCLDIVIKSLTV